MIFPLFTCFLIRGISIWRLEIFESRRNCECLYINKYVERFSFIPSDFLVHFCFAMGLYDIFFVVFDLFFFLLSFVVE